eukprot:584218-Prymnesium_polylepis.1
MRHPRTLVQLEPLGARECLAAVHARGRGEARAQRRKPIAQVVEPTAAVDIAHSARHEEVDLPRSARRAPTVLDERCGRARARAGAAREVAHVDSIARRHDKVSPRASRRRTQLQHVLVRCAPRVELDHQAARWLRRWRLGVVDVPARLALVIARVAVGAKAATLGEPHKKVALVCHARLNGHVEHARHGADARRRGNFLRNHSQRPHGRLGLRERGVPHPHVR